MIQYIEYEEKCVQLGIEKFLVIIYWNFEKGL